MIAYTPEDGSHVELKDMLIDLRKFIPQDKPPQPVVPHVEEALVSPVAQASKPLSIEDLRKFTPEESREVLNQQAVSILSSPNNGLAYEKFCQENQEAIHKCWFVTSNAPNNQILGYTLEDRVETGGFGSVFRARKNDTGEVVAVKILRPEIFWNKEMLQSFRRGVRSMRILTERDVTGIVRCRNAFEIPTSVIMDWVDGPNLEQAVRIGGITTWPEIIFVAKNLAAIVQNGHLLVERVLHRDLRPKNVMLSDYYTDSADFDVVVLDFDLSWHQGAMEQSVTAGRSFSGYLAPEQITPRDGVSTRSAAVDSFGLGMTLYFMLSKTDPLPSQHKHHDWDATLRNLARQRKYTEWQSLPARFARLVAACTEDVQKERLDFSQIASELERLDEVIRMPDQVYYGDLIAEEMLSRIHNGDPSLYEINPNTFSASYVTPIGLKVCLTPNEKHQTLLLEVTWNDTGTLERKSVAKYVSDKLPAIKQPLSTSGWEGVTSNYSAGAFALSAIAPYVHLGRNLSSLTQGLRAAIERMHFN